MSIKISELGISAPLTGNEDVPVVQNGATVKTTTKGIADLIGLTYTAENVANKSSNASLGTSDTLYPTQNAVKTYVDSATTSLIRDRGNYDASSNSFPTSNGSGTGGSVMKGDLWYISVAGTLGGTPVIVGYSIRALVNNPGQNANNWGILNVGLGYVPENLANKSADANLGASDTLYPTQKAVKSYVDSHGGGITSIGISFSTTNIGNDLSVTNSPLTSNGTITLNIPDATSSVRGVVTSSDQSFGGTKTFDKIKLKGIQLDTTQASYSNTGYATLWSPNTSGYNVLNIKTGAGFASSLNMPNTNEYTYTFPTSTGTIALASDISGLVPYTGATGSVNLGSYNIQATKLKFVDSAGATDPWSIYSSNISNGGYDYSYFTISDSKDNPRILISGIKNNTGFENAIIIQGNNTSEVQKSKLLFPSDAAADYTYTFPKVTGTLLCVSDLSTSTNYLPKFNSTGIEKSVIYQEANGNRLGIGTTSPVVRLHLKQTNEDQTEAHIKVETYGVSLNVQGSMYVSPYGEEAGTFYVVSDGHLRLGASNSSIFSYYEIRKNGSHFIGDGFAGYSTNNKFWFKGGTMYVEDRISAVTLGVGFNGSLNASAVFEIRSTSQGFLPPRMTEAQITSISFPATGLMVYQTDGDDGVYVYRGSAWHKLAWATS